MALKTLFLLVALTWLMANAAATRDLPTNPGLDLTTRLETSGGLVECWNALMEIRQCTNEIILFFLNGQTVLGPECCQAISIITRNCWPAMLTSLGFTAEEGNILQGYCNASSGPPTPASPPLYQVGMG
ncbi:hypothetical protein AAG906_029482 [Vitis piasezkii]|uniref:Prolamin-like domain-containing protein n=2 Tax=Vitis vinifera TaxID=29760 RepID=A5AZZ7_VITVI|eukprot:XP_010654474.1 PREDICTED: egg cell-secreted protein 1.4 [Vitis vinifera]